MKVTIDAMLGSARRMSGQLQSDGSGSPKTGTKGRSDSVSISTRLNSRIDSLESELRAIQVSVSRNQVVLDGINQLQDDEGRGGSAREQILAEVRFEGRPVLREYLDQREPGTSLQEAYGQAAMEVKDETERLKRMLVEVENITASELASPEKVNGLVDGIQTVISGVPESGLNSISNLSPENVRRLIG